MMLKRNTDDPEARAYWEFVDKTAAEVATWPAWKRGIDMNRDTILLGDNSADTAAVEQLLKQRDIAYVKVTEATIGFPKPLHPCPTLFVREKTFQGLRAIKDAINTNRYL